MQANRQPAINTQSCKFRHRRRITKNRKKLYQQMASTMPFNPRKIGWYDYEHENEVIIVADYTEDETLTAADLCTICRIEIIEIRNLVEYDILLPLGDATSEEEWQFDHQQLKRLRAALRLRRDLELNYQGIAVVLQLMQEIEELRSINDVYEKHYIK